MHGGITNLVSSTQERYRLGPEDAVLLTTPPTFDAFVLDVF
jgi:non-ribosomal peptide synthetase component F